LEDLIGVRLSTGVVYPVLRSSIRDGLVGVEASLIEGARVYRLSENDLKYLELHESDLKEALRLAESLKRFGSAGYDKLFDLVREIAINAWRLSDAELMELRKVIMDFESRVLEILMIPKGS